MTVRIRQLPKTAMQSGRAKAGRWRVEFIDRQPVSIEPLMGWTSSSDTRRQLQLDFDTLEEAQAYCKRNGLEWSVAGAPAPEPRRRRPNLYVDNFRPDRREPWSH